ncbi:MAG: hypothetical protein E7614_05560 [Ruminococcaceae bacterium]|nr:hypothetical protein [Oscillospiraceae bacterium]
MEKNINFLSDYVLTFGRTFLKESSLLLGWPGSGFCFTFEGTEARIIFGKFKSERHFYFNVSVDKQKQTHCVCTDDQIVIIRGLSQGVHQIRVTKVTECMDRAEISGITISGNVAEFITPDPLPSLKFEFIGDSLTAGFGNMSEPDAGIYRASEQDITFGYSYLTASFYNADARYICCSGKGIFNNWDGSKENRIPDFYDKEYIGSSIAHDFSSWQPDYIFINAGSNDITAKTDPEDFRKAFIDFVKKVHALNPLAFIICIHGTTKDTFSDVFSTIQDELKKEKLKIEFIKFKTISPTQYGALGHPNSNAHAHLARSLIKSLKKIIHR